MEQQRRLSKEIWWMIPIIVDTRIRHTNPNAFRHIQTSRDCYKYSFFPRSITLWNQLPTTPQTQLTISRAWSQLISLRLGFRRNFPSVLHPNLVSSPIKGILEILNLTTQCIPMDILAWTDCVRSSAGKIS
jgi:hypothetical protein